MLPAVAGWKFAPDVVVAKISQGDHVSVSSYLPNARSKQRIAEKLKGLGYLVVKNLVELARCLAARW